MNDNGNAQTPVITPRFEICPVCGFFNKSIKEAENGEKMMKYLVCKGDNDRYRAYAKKIAEEIKQKMLKGEKPPNSLTKPEWVLTQLDLERFEYELKIARNKRIVNPADRVNELLRQAGNGKTLSPEIEDELRPDFQSQAEKEFRDSNYLVRRLWARLQAARKLKPELEQMLAEKAAQTAAPVATS